jgi:hypothetical protein
MKSLLGMLLCLLSLNSLAQDSTNTPAKKVSRTKEELKKLDLSKRASDHLMLQYGLANWTDKGDINLRGFNKTFNAYFLFDFPFKTDPRISVAIGAGVGSDNIYFKNTIVDIKARNGVTFTPDSTSIKFKKNKLSTAYAEIPLELRYSTKPENMNSGWKFALGNKVGTLLDSKMKSKIDLDANNVGGYFQKIKNKKYFNTTRFAVTARAGYGNMSLFASYTVTDFIKQGFGPNVHPYSIGLCLGGL